MIAIYPAASRHTNNHGWLQSNFSFSFADYYDPNNMNFGPLRVFNDDIVQPQTGFGAHPHREMEIVSFVLKGQLQHRDSSGGSSTIGPGEIQRMSAGKGIVHSEMNPSETEEVNFLQLWFEPNQYGIAPSYEEISYDLDAGINTLVPVVSNRLHVPEKTAFIHQDLTVYLSRLEASKTISFTQEAGRKIYLFVIEGELQVNGEHYLMRRDAARITEATSLNLLAKRETTFMLIDLPWPGKITLRICEHTSAGYLYSQNKYPSVSSEGYFFNVSYYITGG